jgi:hypothetical protein
VTVMRLLALVSAGFLLNLLLPPLYALDGKGASKPVLNAEAAKLVGRWEIARAKEPGKPYLAGFQGRPFVTKGPQAYTLILEYRPDGTFRRVCRVGGKDVVQEGRWTLSGHELRHRAKGKSEDEVMYIRFDSADQYTSTEVYEDSPSPGVFAQFRKRKP